MTEKNKFDLIWGTMEVILRAAAAHVGALPNLSDEERIEIFDRAMLTHGQAAEIELATRHSCEKIHKEELDRGN
jgi:hypothetical protein